MARILDSINDPSALTSLDEAELVVLAGELREEILKVVSLNGGHLGSNLGVVELTLALHKVFSSPKDTLLWDTGHQTYAHKLLTGRRESFSTLRQSEGISGYPNRVESDHDFIENSHASVALSWAQGIAAARELVTTDGKVVAVVGDGSLTGGMAYEALSNIGYTKTPVIVVLNDNERSYAPTVSLLSHSAKPFCEALGLQYIGVVDGHDIHQLIETLGQAARLDGPVVVHVKTHKGRGFDTAESDDEKRLHDTGPFDLLTGVEAGKSDTTYTAQFSQDLMKVMSQDSRVVALTAAMPGSTGLLPVLELFPDRAFDVGIAEQHLVGMAAGLASQGLRPVVAVFSTFFNRAWDQVVYDVALHNLPVIFCLDRAGVTGVDGASHNGLLDLGLLGRIPNLTVFAPSCKEELNVMLRSALQIEGPCAIRWPKGEAPSGVVGTGLEPRCVRQGSDGALVGVGRMLERCMNVARQADKLGLELAVWDPRVVFPISTTLVENLQLYAKVISVEDGLVPGGFGERLARRVQPTGVVTLGLDRLFWEHDSVEGVFSKAGLDESSLLRRVMVEF